MSETVKSEKCKRLGCGKPRFGKKSARVKSPFCVEHRAEHRLKLQNEASARYYLRKMQEKKSHTFHFGLDGKLTFWARQNPAKALQLAKRAEATWAIGQLTHLVEKAKADKAAVAAVKAAKVQKSKAA